MASHSYFFANLEEFSFDLLATYFRLELLLSFIEAAKALAIIPVPAMPHVVILIPLYCLIS